MLLQGEDLMELRVLRYFLAVAREGSITGAAHSLNVTQPTLSRQMIELERELGKNLFTRNSRSVSLTAEGLILRKRAEEILDMVSKTTNEVSSVQNTIGGDIYIGSGETQGMRLIAEVIKELQLQYPKLCFHLYSGNAEDVTERLDKGLLDFGILIQPVDLTKYDSITMPVKDTWGLIMRPDSPLADKKTITREDLLNIPLICSRQILRKPSIGNIFADWLGDDFHKIHIAATFNLLFNAALLVEQGVGYATALDNLVNTMAHQNLCFRPFSPQLESDLNIVCKKYQTFSPAAKIFINAVRKKFASIEQITD